MADIQAEALTRRIQQAFDIVDVVGEQVRLARAGKEFKGLCPFHPDRNPSLHVSHAKQIFKCFACGAGGDVFKFIQLRERVDFREARAILAAKAGIPLETERARSIGGPDKAALARVNDWALRWFRKQFQDAAAGAAARTYAEQRRLTRDSLESFAIGAAPDGWQGLCDAATGAGIGKKLLAAAGLAKARPDGSLYDAFRNRLMFPIRDTLGRVVGFGGRALDDDPAKYLNTSQTLLFEKGRHLYGLDAAKSAISEAACAVVVEGYMDCVMAHQHGLRQTVAALGTALTDDQAATLRRYTDHVTIVFDSDEAGERAAERALEVCLSRQLEIRLARVPEAKDPCDYLVSQGAAAFTGLLNSAVPALEWRWTRLLARYRESDSLAGRGRAVREFLRVVGTAIEAGTVDPIHRGLVLNEVARLVGVDAQVLQRELAGGPAIRAVAGPAEAPRPETRLDSAAVATRELLKVLLNEPGYYTSVADAFDPSRLGNAALERIGRAAESVLRRVAGDASLASILAEVESTDDARLLTDLQREGERIGNYAATVEGAVARLQRELLRRRADELRAALRGPSDATEATDAEARSRAELRRQDRHFAPPKHRKTLSARRVAQDGP